MNRSKKTELSAVPTGEGVDPDPEVLARPKRRVFTAKEKLAILQEVDGCTEEGSVGAILRREGIYSSYLTAWRRQRDAGALSALAKKRGRKATRSPLVDENEQLRREVSRLEQRLEQAETIIAVQKKVSEILGIPLKRPRLDGSDS
jgi:transposase